jgi:hypothetical protein
MSSHPDSQTTKQKPQTAFDWLLYADATFAGLSPLIPIPLLDLAFEWFFKRRMLSTVARRRGRKLQPAVYQTINRGEGCAEGCLLWPIKLIFTLLKRISRKILYFLTIKEATDQLSYYWHRAFLLDYMLTLGHLDALESAEIARQALDKVLDTPDTSPLHQFAQQLAQGTRHVWRTLRGARRGQEDELIAEKKSRMAKAWDDFSDYLQEVAVRYQQLYQELEAAREATRLATLTAPAAANPTPTRPSPSEADHTPTRPSPSEADHMPTRPSPSEGEGAGGEGEVGEGVTTPDTPSAPQSSSDEPGEPHPE